MPLNFLELKMVWVWILFGYLKGPPFLVEIIENCEIDLYLRPPGWEGVDTKWGKSNQLSKLFASGLVRLIRT